MKCPHCDSERFIETKTDVDICSYSDSDEEIEVCIDIHIEYCADCGYSEVYI